MAVQQRAYHLVRSANQPDTEESVQRQGIERHSADSPNSYAPPGRWSLEKTGRNSRRHFPKDRATGPADLHLHQTGSIVELMHVNIDDPEPP